MKYLRTLEDWFDKLNDDGDFPKLLEVHHPMLPAYRVFKRCQCYYLLVEVITCLMWHVGFRVPGDDYHIDAVSFNCDAWFYGCTKRCTPWFFIAHSHLLSSFH